MTTQAYLSPELKNDFIQLIAKQTGIEIREQNYRSLKENIALRLHTLSLSSPEAYYQLLAASTSESEKEWQQFVCLMTNRESYFFRDKGQFKLLRNLILPELIQRHQNQKKLKICSAGCSTGQEPYSLAILLRELIPDLENWQVHIMGIDINQESLDTAIRGSYNEWSFRMVSEDIKQRYFRKIHGNYHLEPKIKKMVTFQPVNLVKDPLPRSDYDLKDFDLIICRNVFIYFVDLAIVKVLEKFYNMLQPFGYLMTGHAEVAIQHLKRFQTKLFPESIIYQRPSESLEHLSQPAVATPVHTIPQKSLTRLTPVVPAKPKKIPLASVPITPVDLITEVLKLIEQKSYFLAIPRINKILEKSPYNFQAHYLMAQIYANTGNYQEAINYCEKALKINNFSLDVYYLLVDICGEQGDRDSSKKYLKTILYLFPDAVGAYLKLANIYQDEGDYKRAEKMRQTVLKILHTRPLDQAIPELNNLRVADLITQLETPRL